MVAVAFKTMQKEEAGFTEMVQTFFNREDINQKVTAAAQEALPFWIEYRDTGILSAFAEEKEEKQDPFNMGVGVIVAAQRASDNKKLLSATARIGLNDVVKEFKTALERVPEAEKSKTLQYGCLIRRIEEEKGKF